MPERETHLPTHMPTFNRPRNLGASLDDQTSRLDALAKVTGRAKYSRDQYLPNGLFVGFIRCPTGSGTLESVDEQAALAVPGVLEIVMTGQEGRYQGHNVGYLVAESTTAMTRGLRALQPRWIRRAPQTRITDAMNDPPEMNSEVSALLDQADIVFEAIYSTEVQTHSPFETHGSVVDHRGDSATVYASTQGTFAARDGIDEALGLPASQFEIVCEYIGGGFGSKLNGAGKEGSTAAQVGAKYNRPVYCFVNRAEDHVDTGNRPGSRSSVRMGVTNEGAILGGRIHTWGNVGVASRGGGVSIPSRRYDLGNVQKTHENVQLSSGAPRPFRAPGSPQGAFVEELMLDEIAALTGADPLALRLGIETEEDRREMFQLGARIVGWDQRTPNGSQSGVVKRGLGMGSASWGRFPAEAGAEVVINQDGSVEVRTGSQDIGTGQRTSAAIVVAHNLSVPLDRLHVTIGRSSLPISPGSGGSMTSHNTAPAMAEAALDARAKLLTRVGDQLGIDASELDLRDGTIFHNGAMRMSWDDACHRLGATGLVGAGTWNPQKLQADTTEGHPYGVQFADVRVDTETGVIRIDRIVAIQSCGQVICRKTAESQIIGGVIQGLSYALFENKILDRNIGAMVNANLETYKIAGTNDMPHIEPILWTKGQTGVRSLGEPPTIPTSGAIACAVFNAIGNPVRSLPLTPDKVLDALDGGES